MKKHVSTACLAAAMAIGVALLVYPAASNHWNSCHQSKAIAGYVQSIADTDEAKRAELLCDAENYNLGIAQNGSNFFLSEEESKEYFETLDLDGTGIMGYIDIDVIGCSLPIYHGTDDAVLQIAVGHIPGTSLPVGGSGTHCVLSGHRGLPSAKLFSELDRLAEGDVFVINTLGRILTYEVDKIRVVLPSDASELSIEGGEDLCTLVTCTPYGVNSHRLLVRGHRVENRRTSNIRISADALMFDKILVAPLFAAPIIVFGFVFFFADTSRKEKKKEVTKKLGIKNRDL